ncbi:hypothetical protein EJ06DRAFT_552396 [Trichodelitschia bisporula]|uniref:HECT-type E3 ubiquitin transferase n=1 Tax=Trichodelitschia bisporula TaxID=703511 RepID=A0A6G1I9S1_9PEZI|nr:hypothetical protein EJ06DRAFT_552396 [Trichodelitschia bisporula]
MGKIIKTASVRHEATLSPALAEFIRELSTGSLSGLVEQLNSFPASWPFPRGDLYHWIPVLNRFDTLLDQFNRAYGLDEGPQTLTIGQSTLFGVVDQHRSSDDILLEFPNMESLPANADEDLIEAVLRFTALLLSNCGNRSLYASSAHLSNLLNTTSRRLLIATLRVGLLLAKRYHASKQRLSSLNAPTAALLTNHYNINLNHVHKLASAFDTGAPAARQPVSPSTKKDKMENKQQRNSLGGAVDSTPQGADLVAMAKGLGTDKTWEHWGTVMLTFYENPPTANEELEGNSPDVSSASPSVRHPTQAPAASRTSRLSLSDDSPSAPRATGAESWLPSAQSNWTTIEIDYEDIANRQPEELLEEYLPKVPDSMKYELLHRIRTAQAIYSGQASRDDAVAIRLLAIANLAYVEGETPFQQKISQPDLEEPRRLQLAYQLSELVHPHESGSQVSLELQTLALSTLEALTKQKTKALDVYTALSANVNHGILFYVVRQTVAQLSAEEDPDKAREQKTEEWREALFALLNGLPLAIARAGEAMVSAGLLDILVEILTLRTSRAERAQWKVLNFMDTFIYSVREGYQYLTTAKGLDAIRDLAADLVESSFARAESGNGMPAEYRTRVTDYKIPFYQQLTLRWLFKFLGHLQSTNTGNFSRQLRNLIDSPPILKSLRQVIGNGSVYGSTVWSGAVNIMSSFIHNEPTSYAVIAESRLGETFLEAITAKSDDPNSPVPGIMPVFEAIMAVPTAFGALCLNEAGMRALRQSGALRHFFKIFESAAHVEVMDQEDMPSSLGHAIDELARHQPDLKESIIKAVRDMVEEVGKFCTEKAEAGFGAKLWVGDQTTGLHVAGGKGALRGLDARHRPSEASGGTMEVDRQLVAEADNEPFRCEPDPKEVEEGKGGPYPTVYLSVASRFVWGVFNNTSLCHSFLLGASGFEYVLDFATSPCLPFSFDLYRCNNLYDQLGRMIQNFVEAKPHLTLPSIIKRLDAAVTELSPLVQHDTNDAFFSRFTSTTNSPNTEDRVIRSGTTYAKALVTVHTLCGVLSVTFNSHIFNPRSQTNFFTQVNLADMYVRLLKGLGRLHRSCIWEEILLLKGMPAKWADASKVSSMGFGVDEADDILGIGQHQWRPGSGTRRTSGSNSAANPASGTEEPDLASAQFENTRILRNLLYQSALSISTFCQSLGRTLLVRRVSDSYQRQNAVRVADQMANSMLEELRFALPKASPNAKDRYSYWIVILTTVHQLMIDDTPGPQILTLILQSFKKQGGFTALEEIFTKFFDAAKGGATDAGDEAPQNEESALMNLAMGGIKIILQFYCQIVNSRFINDAHQTLAMTSSSRSMNRERPDFFSTAQFLVELRMAVVKPVRQMWDEPDTGFIKKATTSIVKSLVDVLRTILESDSENGAFTRSEKISQGSKPEPRKWAIKHKEVFRDLSLSYDEDLVREALFRCYDNGENAREYCQALNTDPRISRNPIPMDDVQSSPPSRSPATVPASAILSPNDIISALTTNSDVASIPDLENFTSSYLRDSGHDTPVFPPHLTQPTRTSASRSSSHDEGVEAGNIPGVVTVDDLNEERELIREDAIDRCLDVLSTHDDVTFELAELIAAAVLKAPGQSTLRSDIGTTLLHSLLSLQPDGVEPAQAKKIATYAHLFGLVLQDRRFYEDTRAQLLDEFASLVDFVKLDPATKTQNAVTWVGQVLLILERLLSEDAEPAQIDHKIPGPDEVIKDTPIIVYKPLIPHENKFKLFNAVLDILPHIGKDDTLALSVARILVILTRDRKLAMALGEKNNMRRLFTMIKQLHGVTNERLQGAIMLVLRHIIEDADTIRQIMRSEIQAMFEGKQRRDTDTTAYIRAMHHLVLRSPDIFVEVTNEKLMFKQYDTRQNHQTLVLKKEPPAEESTDQKGKDATEPVSASNKDEPEVEKSKPELKMPVVENPDGVVHFILSELLNYRDVPDIEVSQEKPKDSGTTDVEMANAETGTSSDKPATPKPEKKSEKSEFKIEDHPIFTYRCFLLQCLTELLSCYNRAKIEFINYKRKADPVGTTPSKPRSHVLNYLLNGLIPIGTLEHPDSIAAKKKVATSVWAMLAIVALCQKTGERVHVRLDLLTTRDLSHSEEEFELFYVRKFVLEHALKAFKEVQSNTSESLDQKYSHLMNLADLFQRMLTSKPNGGSSNNAHLTDRFMFSQRLLTKLMYEKNYISALTNAVAEMDLNFPGARRAVKYILRPLKLLSQLAVELSFHSEVPVTQDSEGDEISSATSVSDMDDTREETPDLFRNSALGILDPARQDDSESEDEDEDPDEEMYDDEYADEMEYEEEMHDPDEVVSDEDEDEGMEGMGPIEGLPGDVEVVMDDDDDDMTEGDTDEDGSDEDDEEDMLEEGEDIEDGDGGSDDEGDEEDWGTEEDEAVDYPDDNEDDDDDDVNHRGMQDIVRVFEEAGNPQEIMERLETEGHFDDDVVQDFMEEEMREEDEEEDEEDYDDEDIVYEPGMDEEEEIDLRQNMPWTWDTDSHGFAGRHHHHHHAHIHRHGNPWGLFGGPPGAVDRVFPHAYRSHRPAGGQRANDDGTNPLLQRQGRGSRGTSYSRRGEAMSDWVAALDPARSGRMAADGGPVAFINNLINMMSQGHPPSGSTLHFHISAPGLPLNLPPDIAAALRYPPRYRADQTARPSRDDPSQAVNFNILSTPTRWQEEARILFGASAAEKAARIGTAILALLIPPAREAQKKEAERQQKLKEAHAKVIEEAERETREKREKQEREAREQQEREAAEAAEAEAARAREQAAIGAQQVAASDEMEGVELTQPAAASEEQAAGPSEPAQRITTTIRGRELDITNLGIDLDYLEALPEEFREEVLMTQIAQQRSQAAASGQESSGIEPEFLDALPPEIRHELLQQEAAERRRREREEGRRRTAGTAAAPTAQAEDMDVPSFFATLDPSLRQTLLLESDDDLLAQLPSHIAEEARLLSGDRRLHHYMEPPRPGPGPAAGQPAVEPPKKKPTQYVQILDKAGVATLLRLMFIPVQGSMKHTLNGVLRDACCNKHNRAEIVSTLLSILQDGSNDFNAIERSFAHLSLRAKQTSAQKTPQPKRTNNEPIITSGEMSPLMVVQQCLGTLEFLTQCSPRIAEFFFTEHETSTGFKSRSSRKGKSKESKASRYPLNALLGLLDRSIVIESSPVMEQLASLLQRITHPLSVVLRKDKEKPAEEPKPAESTAEAAPAAEAPAPAPTTAAEESAAIPPPEGVSTGESAPVVGPSDEAKTKEPAPPPADEKKKSRALVTPPEVPEYNLRLIINIIAARECPSKTFKDTLSLITNLSAIPEARDIFGKELIAKAQELAENILDDLEELYAQIFKAKTGTDVQGMALSRFSPASSDQAKLLRVITALDFLFNPKRPDSTTGSDEGLDNALKEDMLTTLYEHKTFGELWKQLSKCLTSIRIRGNMFNVANILLPLIEVLMVVCKNTTLKEVSLAKAAPKEFALSSPPPESHIENLFFEFTEEHRRILNDLVRHNPKLMSGSFSLLVKNSKVLEFDNKRNYFSRKLHSRNAEGRQSHPTLQLQVRRDQVFLDSFRSLYFKKPDEFKYGKLSIRFHGEEGVDAGGVTREWFQVLTKQMFDPNYALFNPVASDRTTFHPNPLSGINGEHLLFFKFIGRVIGKALYEGRVLDCHFSRAVYKRILGRPVSIKDMETLDLEYYKSLSWMLENDITDVITETFSVESDSFGETTTVDLIENGRNILVTEENKAEYVRLVVEYKMIGSVKEQLEHFLAGFHDIVPADLIAIFNEQELELLISGLPDIDVDDWKNNTEYHNYQASSPQIQWFWRAVRSFDKEERAKLLQFVTGTSKVPLNGFKELEGMNGFSRFNIHRDYGNKDRLPSSHTCFNQLDLPEYENYEILRKQLYTAMTAGSEYFGFA